MRFWLQAEEISPNVTYKFFANNKELSGADVRDRLKMGLLASSWKELCVSLHRGLTLRLSAACCHIKAPPSLGEKKKEHPYSQSPFSSALHAIYSSIFPQPNKMGHDASTGIIEFILDHFTDENEGTFTCQITDGGGKAQSSLVLIGDGKNRHQVYMCICIDFYYHYGGKFSWWNIKGVVWCHAIALFFQKLWIHSHTGDH